MSLRSELGEVPRITWLRWGAGIALLALGLVFLARSGRGVDGALAYGPVLIVVAAAVVRQNREVKTLVSRGWHPRDARQRVQRNAWPTLAVIMGAAACWLLVSPLVVGAIGLPGTRSFSGVASFAWVFMSNAALLGWIAVAAGIVLGEGPHCARCGYPVVNVKADRCPECGRVMIAATIREGRLVRQTWTLVLAIVLTLAASGLWLLRSGTGAAAIWMNVAPSAMVIAAATGQDPQLASAAWDQIATRTLDKRHRQALVTEILTKWEVDGALPPAHAKAMVWHIHDELIARRLDDATMDRLVALAPRIRAANGGHALFAALQRASLTAAQRDGLEVSLFLASGMLRSPWMRPEDSRLAGRFASGQLSPVHEQMFVGALRAGNPKTTAYHPLQIAAVIAMRTDVPRIRDMMMDLFLEALEADPNSGVANLEPELFRGAIQEGRLTPEQGALVLLRPWRAALFELWRLKQLMPAERQNVRNLFIEVVALSPTRFQEHQPIAWTWLLSEALDGRLSTEQMALLDAAAEAVEAEMNRRKAVR